MNKKFRNIINYFGISFVILFTLYSVFAVNTFIPPQNMITGNVPYTFANTQVNSSNYVIINITNNITQFVFMNFTNNITNNFTSILVQNITNNITQYNILNISNNITNDIFITNNLTNNITIYSNCSAQFNLTYNTENNITNNITNNYTSIYNYTYYMTSISYYLLAGGNTSYIDFNETKLNETIDDRMSNFHAYGELYNTTTTTRVMTNINTYYNLTSFQNGEMNYVIGNNGYLTINKSGLYAITMLLSGSMTVNNDLQFAFFLNGTIINKSIITVHYQTNPALAHIQFLYRLNQNDVLNLAVQDVTSSGRTLTQDNRNIIIEEIGD